MRPIEDIKLGTEILTKLTQIYGANIEAFFKRMDFYARLAAADIGVCFPADIRPTAALYLMEIINDLVKTTQERDAEMQQVIKDAAKEKMN